MRAASGALDCGNSGTTARLLAGLLAAHRFSATLTGDRSLRRRPMRRVTEPLSVMGARFDPPGSDALPLTVRGGRLAPIRWDLPVSSAQIKSSILRAAMAAGVTASLREPAGLSRDHTERMLRAFGHGCEDRGGRIEFTPAGRVERFEMQVPGDASSAAFLVGAAVLAEAGDVTIEDVGVNPTRSGYLAVLRRMGATVAIDDVDVRFGEPVGRLRAVPARLFATEIAGGEVAGLVDEVPLLAVLASRAEGVTVFREVGELRVKESDRLALVAANLRAVGTRAEASGDTLHVEGGEAPPRGRICTAGDHRLAMAFAVLGTVRGARVSIDDPGCVAVSFPDFPDALRSIRRRA